MKHIQTHILHIVFIILATLPVLNCDQSITVSADALPGNLVGLIVPGGNSATAGVYQATHTRVAYANANADGLFEINDIPAGNYDLKITAPGFGTKIVKNLIIVAGRSLDVGKLELSTLPWPIISINPLQSDSLSALTSITINFQEMLFEETALGAITFEPALENMTITYEDYTANHYPPSGSYVTIQGLSHYGESYLLNIDTTIITETERGLDFPAQLQFAAENLKVASISYPEPSDFGGRIFFTVNGAFEIEEIREHIRILPEPVLSLSSGQITGNTETRIVIEPSNYNAWPSSSITLYIDPGMTDDRTGTLLPDTSLTFVMDRFKVKSTTPKFADISGNHRPDIALFFNTFIDSSSVMDALHIDPNIDFTVTTWDNSIQLECATLLNGGDTVHVSLDSTASDLWGNSMAEDFYFYFTIQ